MNELPEEADATEALLREVRAGQTIAMEQLFAQHRDYLRGMLELRMDAPLRSRVDVSDVIQEAHLEALRRIGDFLDRRNPIARSGHCVSKYCVRRRGATHMPTRSTSMQPRRQLFRAWTSTGKDDFGRLPPFSLGGAITVEAWQVPCWKFAN